LNAGKLSDVQACVIFGMDKRLTDAKEKTIGFIRDSGGREIVTDANGSMKGYFDARNDKTYSVGFATMART
jgi:hypothetical protein